MAKEIRDTFKLEIPAGQAQPSPPVGPALGQRGLNIMEFCKAFNAQTQGMEAGMPIPVAITAYTDRTFTFKLKTPPATYLLKKAAGVKKGAAKSGTETIGSVTKAQVKEIAEKKLVDLNVTGIEAAMRIIEGSARSIGLEVKD